VLTYTAAGGFTNSGLGAVPINGDATATTAAQVNTLFPGILVTNGGSTAITYSNNWTVDAAHELIGTLNGATAGTTLKQIRSLKFLSSAFAKIDGTGVTIPNTNDYTLNTFMVPTFSGTAASNANYIQFMCRVPSDIDTSVAMTASLTTELGGADTAASVYHLGVVSIANSAALAGTATTFISCTNAADGSGASADVESVNDVTLTGWAATLTAKQWMLIELRRSATEVGDTGGATRFRELEIFYTSTQ
jgi:hypothetical protein